MPLARRRLVGVTTLSAFVLFTVLTSAAAAVTLAVAFKKGEARRYRSEMKGTVMGAEFTVTSTEKHLIEDVKENGEAVITISEEETKLTVMGMDQQTPATPPITLTVDRTNRLTNIKELPPVTVFSEPVLRTMYALSRPLLPKQEVADGATWETQVDHPAMPGQKIKIMGAFDGTDKVGDKEYRKVRQSAGVELPGGACRFEDTFWLDPATGHIFRSEGTVKDLPTNFGAMSWSAKIELLP